MVWDSIPKFPKMIHRVLVALVVLVAGSCVQSRVPDFFGIFVDTACYKHLAPSATEGKQLQAAVRLCIAEQKLEVIIDGLRDFGGLVVENDDDSVLLEASGYPKLATELRKCIASRIDLLKADGTVDMNALKTSISDKVTGLPVEANTRLGLKNCPDVEEFDVAEYLQCIGTYCVTGAPPYRR